MLSDYECTNHDHVGRAGQRLYRVHHCACVERSTGTLFRPVNIVYLAMHDRAAFRPLETSVELLVLLLINLPGSTELLATAM